MPEETYFGRTLPELAVIGSAWKHRQAVKKKKGREVANAVREGRNAMAKEVSYWLPMTGTARFIADTANDIKEGDYAGAALNVTLSALPFAVGKALSPAKRMVAGKLMKREPLKMKGKPRERIMAESMEDPVENTDRVFTGNDYHQQRLKSGGYRQFGFTDYPEDDVNRLYRPYNLDNPDDVSRLKRKYNLNDISIEFIKENIDKQNPIVNVPLGKDIDGLFKDVETVYRGSEIKSQGLFNEALPHEVHHGLTMLALKRNGLKRPKPPIDSKNLSQYLLRDYPEKMSDNDKWEYFNNLAYWDSKWNNWDEIAARGTQFKNYYKLKNANEKLSPEQIDHALNYYVKDTGNNNQIDVLKAAIGVNLKEFTDWINKYSSIISAPAAIGLTVDKLSNK